MDDQSKQGRKGDYVCEKGCFDYNYGGFNICERLQGRVIVPCTVVVHCVAAVVVVVADAATAAAAAGCQHRHELLLRQRAVGVGVNIGPEVSALLASERLSLAR